MIVSSLAHCARWASCAVLGIATAGCAQHVASADTSSPASTAAPQHVGPAEPEHPIAAKERAAAIEQLARELEQSYVIPETATRMAQQLRRRLAHGDYAALATGEQFTRTITRELAAIAHDKHLELRYFDAKLPAGPGPASHADPDEAAEQRYLNDGVFEVRRLRFNIGYVNLHAFGRPPAEHKIAAAMRLVKDTAALIVDLRDCGGGDTDTVTLAESYFFSPGTHLLDMYVRTTNKTDAVRAIDALPEPRYAADKPMFVLVNGETISGCEAFAYAMQSHKRATIVGAPTAGAAFFGEPRRLSDHVMAFIPLGRPIDPITHADWEGRGVTPNEAVDAGKALDIAERLTLESLAPREPSPRRRTAMQQRIVELRSTNAAPHERPASPGGR